MKEDLIFGVVPVQGRGPISTKSDYDDDDREDENYHKGTHMFNKDQELSFFEKIEQSIIISPNSFMF